MKQPIALADASPRLRITFAPGMRLGPGKMDLIEAVGRTGSISAAGRELGMSYRRAWLLIDQVNGVFTEPVVVASAGGAQGGGAQLTPLGTAILAAYRQVEAETTTSIQRNFVPFEAKFAAAPEKPISDQGE